MKTKKQIRENFRAAVFTRDKSTCRICGDTESKLDAHHIENRNLFTNGGYVLSNGITLCDKPDGCHIEVEKFYMDSTINNDTENPLHPNRLYKKIGSSFEQAIKDDLKNK